MLGAVKNVGELLPFEVKRCEVLPTPPLKRTARMGGGEGGATWKDRGSRRCGRHPIA